MAQTEADSLGEEHFEKLGEEKDEEGELLMGQRREYTVFWFDLGESPSVCRGQEY